MTARIANINTGPCFDRLRSGYSRYIVQVIITNSLGQRRKVCYKKGSTMHIEVQKNQHFQQYDDIANITNIQHFLEAKVRQILNVFQEKGGAPLL